MQIDPRQFQVRREQQLRDEVVGDFGVRKALAKIREVRGGKGYGYRRGLLSSTLRLTRSMSPEIADTVAWLVSDAGRHISGVTLPIDAGYVNKR